MSKQRQPRVLVVRVGAMGDVLHALPAVARLRAALPEAFLGWAVEPRWAALLESRESNGESNAQGIPNILNAATGHDAADARAIDPAAAPHAVQAKAINLSELDPDFLEPNTSDRNAERAPLVDAVHPVEAKQWNRDPISRRTLRSILALRRALRAERYDLAIDLQGTLRSAVIARLSGAPVVVGSSTPREGAARLLYHHRVTQTAIHVVDRGTELVDAALGLLKQTAGTPPAPSPPLPRAADAATPLPHHAAAEQWWHGTRPHLCRERPPILLAATAGWGAKEWPPAKFAALAAALAAEGYAILLNTAPGAPDPVSAAVLQTVAATHPAAAPHVHLLPATLPELIAATREMHAVIAGDTGPLHLAEALDVPTVGLFGPTDPRRTGTRRRAICLRDPSSVTNHRRHAETETGLAHLPVDSVLEALHRVLANATHETPQP